MKRKALHIRRYYRLRWELTEIHPERDYFRLPDYITDGADDIADFEN